VKTLFVSRFGDAGVIEQSDFSSLEVYVQAILTHCKLLIEDLKAGTDLHCMRLALKEHMEYGEVFALCKGDNALPEWDYKRTAAKVFSFQRAYGAGAAKIAASTGMPIEEVEALTAAERVRWPEIDTYFDKRSEEIKRNRKPTNVSVPHPVNPAIMCQLGISRVSTPDGKKYTYRESPSPAYLLKRGMISSFSPTEIKNYEVQGLGGEWMKAAMWLMIRAWYARRNFGGLSLLVNSVHDAAYSDSHVSVKDEAAAVMHACMEGASDLIEWWFNWPLPLPVPSDTVCGASMAEENKFTSNEFKARCREIRAELRRDYMNGHTPSYLKENQ
jgi:DNA polymerase I-like protein with 3'-5' exonuclease and polymerase domains